MKKVTPELELSNLHAKERRVNRLELHLEHLCSDFFSTWTHALSTDVSNTVSTECRPALLLRSPLQSCCRDACDTVLAVM